VSTPDHAVIIKLYCTHQDFFYQNYFRDFKLFVTWYLQEECGTQSIGPQLPWYKRNYEVQELAKILKCSETELLTVLSEVCDV
jgi:hypothetical protein